jgi:hypothetical protein
VPLPLSLKPLPCSSCDGFWLYAPICAYSSCVMFYFTRIAAWLTGQLYQVFT